MAQRVNAAMLIPLGLAAILLAVGPATAQSPPPGAPTGPTQVGTVTLHPAAGPVTAELPGRVSASQTTDVRPQVGGIIKTVGFRPGQTVTQGDVLYQIDSATYNAQVAVQRAALQKAQAAQTNAEATLDRDKALAATSTLSQSDLQTAELAVAQAKADVASATASLDAAQINADLTKVVAPISGLISDTAVTQGALVTAAQATALATIRQLDPSYVDLVETSANLLKLRDRIDSGAVTRASNTTNATTVHLTLEDGSAYEPVGTLTLADVVVSQSTGTFGIRVTIANPKRLLLPGMFVRATVDLGTETNAYRVPQRAVTFNSNGEAVALFVESGKAVSHTLTTNGTIANDWIVTGGVTDGAQLIVDGLQKISSGSAVTAVPVTIDAQGVATDAASSASAGTPDATAPAAASAAK